MQLKRTESQIQLAILDYLAATGWRAGKTKTMGVRRGKVFCRDPRVMKGKCDVEAFKGDVMLGIEVKSASGQLRPEQKKYAKDFHRPPGRIYIVARSVTDVAVLLMKG